MTDIDDITFTIDDEQKKKEENNENDMNDDENVNNDVNQDENVEQTNENIIEINENNDESNDIQDENEGHHEENILQNNDENVNNDVNQDENVEQTNENNTEILSETVVNNTENTENITENSANNDENVIKQGEYEDENRDENSEISHEIIVNDTPSKIPDDDDITQNIENNDENITNQDEKIQENTEETIENTSQTTENISIQDENNDKNDINTSETTNINTPSKNPDDENITTFTIDNNENVINSDPIPQIILAEEEEEEFSDLNETSNNNENNTENDSNTQRSTASTNEIATETTTKTENTSSQTVETTTETTPRTTNTTTITVDTSTETTPTKAETATNTTTNNTTSSTQTTPITEQPVININININNKDEKQEEKPSEPTLPPITSSDPHPENGLNITSTLFYLKPITIDDPQHQIAINTTSKSKFLILFASVLPSNLSKNIISVLSSTSIDTKFLREHTILKPKSDLPTIFFPNFPIFKNITKQELIYILAFLFELHISSIDITLSEDPSSYICSNNIHIKEMIDNETSATYNHTLSLSTIHHDLLAQTISIGDASISVSITANSENKHNIYEEIFYTNYRNIMLYIKKILTKYPPDKDTFILFNPNITQIRVSLVYYGPSNTHSHIDIERMFNIHHAGRLFSKIYIHSDDIDTYYATPRQLQYVKVNKTASNVFKGVSSLYNTCSLYIGVNVENGVILHHIDVSRDMTLNFIFTNTNSNYNYHSLTQILRNWMDTYMSVWLKRIKLSECVYSIDFNYKYYIPIFNGINANINISGVSTSDIESISQIIMQDIPQSRFQTRTSLQFSGYEFYTLGTYYKCMYQLHVHEFLTTHILFKEMFPILHVGMNSDTDLTVSVTDASNFSEILFMFTYIIGMFKSSSSNTSSSSELSLESIRANAKKHNKNLLKILMKIDPALFGTRKVGNNTRSFSGLCQQAKQRSVPITVDEYEYLKNIVPDSVTNIRNQTFPDQRLYLFCPYKQFSFLNYHHFPNQLCIVRCTTKPSNKTQYNYCVNALGAEHSVQIQNKYENQTITLYNPLITKGRKCKLPDELKLVLVNYILLKLNINTSLVKYCLNSYNKFPFIIRRDVEQEKYYILSEYNEDYDYILILQSELNDDYFIFLREITNTPLFFSENEEVKKFFSTNVKKTTKQYNFFNFLEKIFNTNINQYYNLTNKSLLLKLKNEYNLKYVTNGKYIRGIIYKDCLYLTPSFYWQFEETDFFTITLYKAIENVMNNNFHLPSISIFDPSNIKTLYIDYTTRLVHMITFYGVNVLVTGFEISAKFSDKEQITFDYNSILYSLYNINVGENDKFIDTQIQKYQIGEILKNYVFMFTMHYGSIDAETLTKKLLAMNVIYDSETFIDYADKRHKQAVMWRTSKINTEDYNEYIKKYQSFETNDIIKSIYDKFQDELRFRLFDDEVVYSKIITI